MSTRFATLPERVASASVAAPRGRHISGKKVLTLTLPGLLTLDSLIVAGAFLAAVEACGFHFSGPYGVEFVVPPLLLLPAVMMGGFLLLGWMFGLYQRVSLYSPKTAFRRAMKAVFWSGGLAVGLDFLLAAAPYSALRGLLVAHGAFLAVAVTTLRPLACRLLLHLAETEGDLPRRLLVVGASWEASRVAAVLEQSGAGSLHVVGLVERGPADPVGRQRWPRFEISEAEEVVDLAERLGVTEVILASRRFGRREAAEMATRLSRLGMQMLVVPHLTRLYVDGVPVERGLGVPAVRLGNIAVRGAGAVAKRVADVVLSIVGGIAILPLLLLIALAVKLSSPGPVLYAQTRVGRNGKHFKMYKFRSMVARNDDTKHRQYVETLLRNGREATRDEMGRPVYKLVDDARITRVGRLLRRLSLDELPQLINVLRGEMSLVGPRPCLPFEYEIYEPWQKRRLDVTPGMTGLWQVSGRSLLSFEEMVLLDLYYAANWSFLLDMKLVWRTIPEVVYGRGAH